MAAKDPFIVAMPRRMQNGVIILAAILAIVIIFCYATRPTPRPKEKAPEVPFGLQMAQSSTEAED